MVGCWHLALTPVTTEVVQDVFFKNNTTGYAVTGNGAVWKSTDGGFNRTITDPLSISSIPSGLAVTFDDKLFIKVPFLICQSANGCLFTYQSVNDVQGEYSDMYFVPNETGYISGDVPPLIHLVACGKQQMKELHGRKPVGN